MTSPLSHCNTVIHRVPKPAALLKPRKSKAWPGFKQQCSWDLLHFRQTALAVSLAINSPCGCLPQPRKRGFWWGGGNTHSHRLITVGSNESFVSAAQGQQASRCCYIKGLIVGRAFRCCRHGCDGSAREMPAVQWVDGPKLCQPCGSSLSRDVNICLIYLLVLLGMTRWYVRMCLFSLPCSSVV